jgi:hypothetical protein
VWQCINILDIDICITVVEKCRTVSEILKHLFVLTNLVGHILQPKYVGSNNHLLIKICK